MRVTDHPLFFFIVLASFLALLGRSSAQWKPQDVFRISCGESRSDIDGNGLEWTPDAENPRLVAGGTPTNSTRGTSGTSVPYRAARVFTSPASYSFSISPGRHWVRLHFAPLADASSRARFSVAIGSRLLVANSSIAEDIAAGNGSSPVVREFTIHTSGTAVAVTLTPSASFIAFVSGIELISMARDALSPSVVEISPEASESRQVEIAGILARTLYRLNVGGDLIAPGNDSSSQARTWLPDEPFLQGVARGVPVPPAVPDIVYPATVPEYIAPRGVYGTARSLGGSNTVTNAFNISWAFSVAPGYAHYVRLHFAELVYSSPMQRIFSVYINNRTAIRALDLIQQTGAANTPYYRDFLVLPVDGLANLRLQVGPLTGSNSQVQDAILNGVEIFRLNDSSGSVDGLAVVPRSSDSGGNGGHHLGVIIGCVAGGVFALVAIALAICFFFRCCKGGGKKPSTSSWQALGNGHPHHHHHAFSLTTLGSTMGAGSPRSAAGSYYNAGSAASAGGHGRYFTLQEIAEATNSFDETRLLGVGGFGRVYKGEIDNGTLEVAVKRGNPRSEQGIAEFQAEIGLLSKLRHRHLVSLIGYCDEQSEMILVYEYMARGPLRGHLYGTEDLQPLPWRHRLEILVGAARGLHYLHTGAAIIHRDVKTTNILLDEHLVAKVSDFGLSKTGPMLDQTHVSTAVKGSFGYLDPEYFRRQQLTDKSDVYSFGVVMVEVMCARPAIDPALPREQVNIAEWAMSAQRSGRLEEILDPTLRRPGSDEDADMASVRKVGETADKCLQENGVQRPSMGDVLWNLESALHIQEAAQRRFGRENGGGGGDAGGGVAAPAAGAVENGGATSSVPISARQAPGQASNESQRTTSEVTDDYYDGYSEDASASAVFSQLVNPQGR
ncbi:receptor-like protein kinase THESEUS 1 [Selaginella moellendorffii]|uniref:receptor-like protein kinase THESEUS 1 n=1 Tax=Selaginella moellendorffii TaxID=88036 RepID=UPI000D1C5E9A|nr:receptor-like protein kinase THESEUS 1 [Selaginella moellendorffii]|eukprot:XP_024543503.1 receptor-like protein kinase THESEUS 1 [Selaginella moellendorffii]